MLLLVTERFIGEFIPSHTYNFYYFNNLRRKFERPVLFFLTIRNAALHVTCSSLGSLAGDCVTWQAGEALIGLRIRCRWNPPLHAGHGDVLHGSLRRTSVTSLGRQITPRQTEPTHPLTRSRSNFLEREYSRTKNKRRRRRRRKRRRRRIRSVWKQRTMSKEYYNMMNKLAPVFFCLLFIVQITACLSLCMMRNIIQRKAPAVLWVSLLCVHDKKKTIYTAPNFCELSLTFVSLYEIERKKRRMYLIVSLCHFRFYLMPNSESNHSIRHRLFGHLMVCSHSLCLPL